MRILHISSHLGGGVGKVLSNISVYSNNGRSKYTHEIILLEEPEKYQFVDLARDGGVEVHISPDKSFIEKKMADADIVQVEWWHHPLMAEFLSNFPAVNVRLVIWSHIAGCFPPIIRGDFVKESSRFLFTSPVSREGQYLKSSGEDFIKENTDVVHSSGGFEEVSEIERVQHKDFNIGYVGTLAFSKLHPDYVDFCASVNIQEAKFIMVGDTITKDIVEKQAEDKNLSRQLEFVGYTPRVSEQLARFDVFGYPLNPEHYGTTENALLEAMASGIPPVVLSQCTEKYLVKHMHTGMVVKNKEEYGEAMRYLHQRPDERIRLGKNARSYILTEFSVDKTVERLNKNYDIVMNTEKRVFSYMQIFGDKPYEWFLSCLGNDAEPFVKSMSLNRQAGSVEIQEVEKQIRNCRRILKEKSKSSVFHFNRCFPEDPWLTYWSDLIGGGSC